MADIKQIKVGNDTYDIKDAAARGGLSSKVDKVTGKGLSTNDYTTDEKNKLAGIPADAAANVQADFAQTDTSADDYIKNKPVFPDVSEKADKVSGATSGDVATLNASGNLVDSGKTLGKSVPSDAVFTDTMNTAGSTDTGSKIYLIGATSQAANPQTYSQDTAFVGTDGCLYSGGSKVLTSHQDISGKADKVSGATSGNFAGLDANGNLTDSGKKPGDLLTLGTSSSTAYRGDRGNTAYTHATETRLTTATAQGLYKVGSTAQGHISGLTAVAKSDITALGIPAQDTTYESKSASSGGTAVSLCTTGEKYTWNNKQNALSSMSQSEADTGTSTTGRIITAKVLTDSIHKKAHTMYGAIQLSSTSSTNLNNYTAPTYSGEYYYPIHGHSITNMPTGATGKPFRLVVESLSNKDADILTGTGDLDYSSANCTLQTLIVSDIAGTPSVKTYRRHYLNSTWSSWYSYEDEIASLNSRLADKPVLIASKEYNVTLTTDGNNKTLSKEIQYGDVYNKSLDGYFAVMVKLSVNNNNSYDWGSVAGGYTLGRSNTAVIYPSMCVSPAGESIEIGDRETNHGLFMMVAMHTGKTSPYVWLYSKMSLSDTTNKVKYELYGLPRQ